VNGCIPRLAQNPICRIIVILPVLVGAVIIMRWRRRIIPGITQSGRSSSGAATRSSKSSSSRLRPEPASSTVPRSSVSRSSTSAASSPASMRAIVSFDARLIRRRLEHSLILPAYVVAELIAGTLAISAMSLSGPPIDARSPRCDATVFGSTAAPTACNSKMASKMRRCAGL
jgi:hypothetical protein